MFLNILKSAVLLSFLGLGIGLIVSKFIFPGILLGFLGMLGMTLSSLRLR